MPCLLFSIQLRFLPPVFSAPLISTNSVGWIFLLLEVKKASTIEVSLLLGDCQSLLCDAFEVFQKGCLSIGLKNFLGERTTLAKLATSDFLATLWFCFCCDSDSEIIWIVLDLYLL